MQALENKTSSFWGLPNSEMMEDDVYMIYYYYWVIIITIIIGFLRILF